MPKILRSHVLSKFTCLGDKCEDGCCWGWSMQVDEPTLERYKTEAPQLLEAVETLPSGAHIMRKDPATSLCVKLEGGLCGIHKTLGEKFLGDACYFYPRSTRALGNQTIMTATMSCPEITRLALADDQACGLEEATADRLPQSLKDYLPDGAAAEDAITVHQAFLKAAQDTQASPERIFLRIASVSRSFERLNPKDWAGAVQLYLANADNRLPVAEINPADPFNILHTLCGLAVASKEKLSARLKQTINDMEKALAVKLDWEKVWIDATPESMPSYQRIKNLWDNEGAAKYAPFLRRYLQMQLALALYPYAGLGDNLSGRITIIGARLATIKLALMCSCSVYGVAMPQDVVVRTIQSISRFLDHLRKPALSMQIYAEIGWINEKRMRGLMEG